MDIAESYLSKQAEKFEAGRKRVVERRKSWDDFERRAKVYFDEICVQAKKVQLFEFLYVETKTTPNKLDDKYPPFVNLRFGSHPTGLYDFTAKDRLALDAEGGCALSINQFPTGIVVCLLYPFESNLQKPNRTRYIYKIYESPLKIDDRELRKLMKALFTIAHYSSYFGKSGLMRCLKYNWFCFKCWRTEHIYCDAVMRGLVKLVANLTEEAMHKTIAH